MSKICLIRHGETDWNRQRILQGQTDIALNEAGARQVRESGRLLKDTKWDAIFSSPLKRASESAGIIAESIGLSEIIYDNWLMEQCYGAAEGLSKKARMEKYPIRPFPGEEPWEDFRTRVMEFITSIAGEKKEMNIIVVSHGGAINAVLHTLSDGRIGSGITRLGNGCVSMLNNMDGELTIEYCNRMPEEMHDD